MHWFVIALIRLFDRNFQTDKRLSRSRHTRHKTDAFFILALTVPHYLQNIGNSLIGRYLIRLVPCYVLNRMIFV